MKTKLLLASFALLFTFEQSLKAQDKDNAYYLALKLKEIRIRLNGFSAIEIKDLEGKVQESLAVAGNKKYENVIKFIKNPFDGTVLPTIKDDVNDLYKEIISKQEKFSGQHGLGSITLAAIPTPLQSILVDGTSKYIAERFRGEITALYINKFRNTLTKDPLKDFKLLTPKTYTYLEEGDFFKFKEISSEVKENFESDLDNILVGLKDFVDKGVITQKMRDNNNDSYRGVYFSLDLGQQLKLKKPFKEIIDYLEANYRSKQGFDKYYQLIHTVNLLQNNIRREEEKRGVAALAGNMEYKNYWLKSSDLAKLNDPIDWVSFTGFIYQDNKSFFKELAQDYIAKKITPESLQEYTLKVIGILQNIEMIHANQQIQAESYIEMFSNLAGLIQIVNDKHKFLDSKYIKITGYSIDIAKTILKKNYANTVPAGEKLLNEILNNEGDNKEKIIGAFVKYGTFIVDITTAKNSDDVKEALEKNVTKYSHLDKLRSPVSLTLNADPGIAYNNVSAKNLSSMDMEREKGQRFNVTTPIGVELGFSIKQKVYIGLVGSLFDIGAPFYYRLGDASSELPEKLELKQILSYGYSVKIGIKESPIVLSLGYQRLPTLRELTTSGATTVEKTVQAFSVKLTWDMPLAKLIGSK